MTWTTHELREAAESRGSQGPRHRPQGCRPPLTEHERTCLTLPVLVDLEALGGGPGIGSWCRPEGVGVAVACPGPAQQGLPGARWPRATGERDGCLVEGCLNQPAGRLCGKHRRLERLYGDPTAGKVQRDRPLPHLLSGRLRPPLQREGPVPAPLRGTSSSGQNREAPTCRVISTGSCRSPASGRLSIHPGQKTTDPGGRVTSPTIGAAAVPYILPKWPSLTNDDRVQISIRCQRERVAARRPIVSSAAADRDAAFSGRLLG